MFSIGIISVKEKILNTAERMLSTTAQHTYFLYGAMKRLRSAIKSFIPLSWSFNLCKGNDYFQTLPEINQQFCPPQLGPQLGNPLFFPPDKKFFPRVVKKYLLVVRKSTSKFHNTPCATRYKRYSKILTYPPLFTNILYILIYKYKFEPQLTNTYCGVASVARSNF